MDKVCKCIVGACLCSLAWTAVDHGKKAAETLRDSRVISSLFSGTGTSTASYSGSGTIGTSTSSNVAMSPVVSGMVARMMASTWDSHVRMDDRSISWALGTDLVLGPTVSGNPSAIFLSTSGTRRPMA